MIINAEKLEGCTNNIKNFPALVQWLYPTSKIFVNSGFRSPEKNASLPNSSKTSAHLTGQAIDLTVENVHCVKVAGKILENIGKFPFLKAMFIDVYKNYLHLDEKDRGQKDLIIAVYGKDGNLA